MSPPPLTSLQRQHSTGAAARVLGLWLASLCSVTCMAGPAVLRSEATSSQLTPANPTAVQAAARLASRQLGQQTKSPAVAASARGVSARSVTSGLILLRQRLKTSAPAHKMDVALTLDACSGSVDMNLLQGLVRQRVPVTVFVTRKWLVSNGPAVALMLEHPGLFQFENHGAMHVPPVIGASVYGLRGVRDEAALREEVSGGTEAMVQMLRKPARWYRGAGAHYDARSLNIIGEMGYLVAGFSLNGDDGATLTAQQVMSRLLQIRPGDIVLAHMNHPKSGTGPGLLEVLPQLVSRGFNFVTLSNADGIETY